MEEANTLVNAL